MDRLAIYELEHEGYLLSKHFTGKDKFLFINETIDIKTDVSGLYLLNCTITNSSRIAGVLSRSILRDTVVTTNDIYIDRCTIVGDIRYTDGVKLDISNTKFPSLAAAVGTNVRCLTSNSARMGEFYYRIVGEHMVDGRAMPILEDCDETAIMYGTPSFICLDITLSGRAAYNHEKNTWVKSNIKIEISPDAN